ncbi:MAG: cofactor-independent phosphoglycerate mutase [Ruminococcus sp.]|jgi:2,3-bisphosphoglycerate-independent phosphoglycerate mutase|nr:cofactor-independent phosphoglycerate mutase [Ruminococcus sp.]
MKYIVLLCDGMADEAVPELGGKTPMEAAKKPAMDKLCAVSEVGLVKTVADGLKPGSDVANLSVLGYDPKVCYTGRSPLEAGSIGIDMNDTDISLRCNLVTLSGEANYADKTMVDYCAGDISSEEADVLIAAAAERFDNETRKLYAGVSYRHCLIRHNGSLSLGKLTPPHDISGRVIADFLPDENNPYSAELLSMMKESYEFLSAHPINKKRIAEGKNPANSLWFWGEGKRASLEPFKEKFGLRGAMISAVDLLRGIGKFAGMDIIKVPGATAYLDTNFEGKADAAIKALSDGCDFVYIHIEAPDECGHRGEVQNKVKAIEEIDSRVLSRILPKLDEMGEYKLLICPDHPTPLSTKTHTNAPVPYMIYDRQHPQSGPDIFTEKTAEETGNFIPFGPDLMKRFIG